MEGPISFSLIVPVYDYDKGCDILFNVNIMNCKLGELLSKGAIRDYELIIIHSDFEMFLCSNQGLDRHIRFTYNGGNTELGNMFGVGIHIASKEYVGLVTPYNQVDLNSLDAIIEALRDCDMAVAYIGNLGTRPWYREIVSALNTVLVNLFFGLKLKYYHLNFYRTDLVKRVEITTDSHAAMVEAAVWLAKSGARTTQVPFTMIPHNFKSKSRVFRVKNIIEIFKIYSRLFWRVRILGEKINLV